MGGNDWIRDVMYGFWLGVGIQISLALVGMVAFALVLLLGLVFGYVLHL